MADTPAATPDPTGQPPPGTQRAALPRLQRHAFLLLVGLLASLIAAVAVVVVLIDAPSTSDLQKLGVIAAVAGLAGGSARGVVEVSGLVRRGFRANDDETVIYDAFARRLYEDTERRYERHMERYHAAEEAGEDTRDLARPMPPLDPILFSPELMAQYMIIPFTGAAFGVVVFAGVVGGFLVASTAAASYSPPALAFLAFLGGMFSDQFLAKLASTARVLFGDDSQASQPRTDR